MPKKKREGLYRQPGSPYWYASFVDATGRRQRISTKTASKTEAKYIRDEIVRKVRMEEFSLPTRGGETVAGFAEEYLKWAKGQQDFRSKNLRMRTWIIPHLGDVPLQRMGVRQVEQLQQAIIDKGRTTATANRVVAIVKHMMTKAVEWEKVSPNVLAKVRQVKLLREAPGRIRYLDRDEADRLVKCCNPKLRPIVIVALYTGMRRGEILNLQWDDLDLKQGFVHVRKSKSGKSRSIPINDDVRDALQAVPRFLESPWVFWLGDRGKAQKDIRTAWKTALRNAAIKGFKFHDLRHYAESGIMPNRRPMPSLCGADLGLHSA